MFKNDFNNPPGLELTDDSSDWLVPIAVAKSESVAIAVAYSIDHNATTIKGAGLTQEQELSLFDLNALGNQLSYIGDNQISSLASWDAGLEDILQSIAIADYGGEPSSDHEDDEDGGQDENGDGNENRSRFESVEVPDDIDDDLDPLSETPSRVKKGDVWALGKHRLYCWDSLDRDAIEKFLKGVIPDVVWSDPPYGIEIVSGKGSIGSAKPFGSKGKQSSEKVIEVGSYAPIAGDHTIETAFRASEIYLDWFGDAVHFWWGANYYANSLPTLVVGLFGIKTTQATLLMVSLPGSIKTRA